MGRRPLRILPAVLLLSTFAPVASADEPETRPVDLTRAVVYRPESFDGPAAKAVSMLVEEVEKRTGVRWPVTSRPPEPGTPTLWVGRRGNRDPWPEPLREKLDRLATSDDPEGYRVAAVDEQVGVEGRDDRGVLYGIGRLLRSLRMGPGRVALPRGFAAGEAPKVALRGHQLGYRPKTNSYDAWDLPRWESYVRDLAVFGANAVELLPPRTDDDADSPHFPRPPLEMMVGMSKLLDAYGLDAWVWFPAMDPSYDDPKAVAAALKEWGDVFRALPRLDAVFVPGSDPGHTRPKVLFALLEQVAGVLRESHPKATVWVSPQGFDAVWMAEFLDLLQGKPAWLRGLVYGPQIRVPLAELRKNVPSRYPIRGYPDVTHSRHCQHPVPDWDLAFAATEGREAINPRPLAQAAIFRTYLDATSGFITYSEGCNDDVNKTVWSALGWDPGADVNEVLREYGRYFLGDREADAFARVAVGLERNWSGPLLANASVETTLRQVEDLERTASPALKANWRFQQIAYRAYYDAYVRDRLVAETAAQARAMDWLRRAPAVGSDAAIRRASDALDGPIVDPVSPDRRARVFELGEALFQSIGMQLSVPRYRAIAAERGANLDTIDAPLNDRVWLAEQFAEVRALGNEPDRLRAIDGLARRTDPGPGGFYDDLGDPGNQPHLVRDPTPDADPALVRAVFTGFGLRDDWPTAWRQCAQANHDAPIRLRYDGLDPSASYTVRVVYAGDAMRTRILLDADGAEVHPLLAKPTPVRPLEFPVPPGSTADGRLELRWTQEPGRGGSGRGCQVAEVWLLRAGP